MNAKLKINLISALFSVPPFAIVNSTLLNMPHEIKLTSLEFPLILSFILNFIVPVFVQPDYKEEQTDFHVPSVIAIFSTSIMSFYSLFSFAG